MTVQDYPQKNLFLPEWERLEASHARPMFGRALIESDFNEFAENVKKQDPDFVKHITESLYAGDVYVLKRAFPKEFMEQLKRDVAEFWSKSPSSFHKMVEGCPDFHRIIDEAVSGNYSIRAIRHSGYFFPWNGDPLALFPEIMKRWRVFKFLGGFAWDAYEKNTPKDGIVDRVHIAQYTPQSVIVDHSDPYLNQRVFISGYMSKRGGDYSEGGFYFVNSKKERVIVEDSIDVGDMGIGYATVIHGVEKIDPHKKREWSESAGRWFMGLYSNTSDEVKDRHTGYGVDLGKIK